MPSLFREVSLAAGAINDNIWNGSAYEFAQGNQIISIGLTAAAAGTFATIQSGGQVLAEEFSPPVLTRYPIIPDEMYVSAAQVAGDRNVLRWRNPTAGPIVVRAVMQAAMVR